MKTHRTLRGAATLAVALGLSLAFTAGAQAAASSTVTACVNAKSGATKVLLGKKAKKKCAKGWQKVTWNTAGQTGKNGTNGTNGANGTNGTNGTNGLNSPPLTLRDANGTVLGALLGTFPISGPIPIYFVYTQGGIYTYIGSGQLYSISSTPPVYLNSACTGQAYLTAPGSTYSTLIAPLVGSPSRIVFRAGTVPLLGVPQAWSIGSGHSTIPSPAPSAWSPDTSTGVCTSTTITAGDQLVSLTSVPAPPDGVGPLTIGS